MLAVLLTALGVFVCPGLRCTRTPHPGLEGFWQPPRLYLVVRHRAFGLLDCRLARDFTIVDDWKVPEALWYCMGSSSG